MANKSCSLTRTVVCTCSGVANVGQIANQAAVDLQQEDVATMLCLAAIDSQNEDMIALGLSADRVVGIDGCDRACTKKALEHAEVPMTDHVVVTDLNLTKKPHDGTIDAGAVTRVTNAVKGRLDSIAGGHG
jgi:uncharacterized metal-binding protein